MSRHDQLSDRYFGRIGSPTDPGQQSSPRASFEHCVIDDFSEQLAAYTIKKGCATYDVVGDVSGFAARFEASIRTQDHVHAVGVPRLECVQRVPVASLGEHLRVRRLQQRLGSHPPSGPSWIASLTA